MIDGLSSVLKQFSIEPHDISLYETAFTHASYTNEHPECPSYDRLEFLGDAILDMVIAEELYRRYPEMDSGAMSKARSVLIEGKTLTQFSEERFGFAPLVRYSVGERGNTRFHRHIDEDIFEAFVGACYLDQGFAFVRRLLIDVYAPLLPDLLRRMEESDPKTRLQELLQSNIEYILVEQSNLNSPDVSYRVNAQIQGTVLGTGVGHNTKEAEMNAARDALSKRVGE